ncbi:galactose mutarotase-like protein [Lanmaoa asiatica]|nr:galactose mutarotase-like protein [Lanmaoa asiatica]
MPGASAELLLYGATVISWKAGTHANTVPVERLFLSSKAALDGSKPVRGGIPVVFPCFGPPSHPEHARLGQHGFARSQAWTFDSVVMDDMSDCRATALGPTDSIKATYDRSFQLAYVVTLGEYQLSTDLHVTNTSRSSVYPPDNLEFQALFHNYIRAPANQVLVFPLQNNTYYDKTETSEEGQNKGKTETRAGVDVQKYTDSVYEDASQKYEVTWPGGGVEIKVMGLKDVVLWNPQQAVGSKIADMEDGGWEKYVCIEPGHVRGYLKVEPGRTWIGQQVISVIHDERRI